MLVGKIGDDDDSLSQDVALVDHKRRHIGERIDLEEVVTFRRASVLNVEVAQLGVEFETCDKWMKRSRSVAWEDTIGGL